VAELETALGVLKETIFPGRCLLCGGWLLLASDHSLPVCDTCCGKLFTLAEPRCTKCGVELISENGTCLRCRTADYMFDSNMSVFAYTGEAKRLLVSLKFEQRRRLAPFFAAYVARLLEVSGWKGAVVPVPPRPDRWMPDAAELVARSLERYHGVFVLRTLLRTEGVQQKSLDYEQRKENLKGQIYLSPRSRQGREQRAGSAHDAVPRQAVLLDDVFTTGATLDACARTLRAAGCIEVNAVTLVMEE